MSKGHEEYVKPAVACKVLGVTPGTLRDWAKAGLIGFITMPSGRRHYDVEGFLASRRSGVVRKASPDQAPVKESTQAQKPLAEAAPVNAPAQVAEAPKIFAGSLVRSGAVRARVRRHTQNKQLPRSEAALLAIINELSGETDQQQQVVAPMPSLGGSNSRAGT